jgi:Na+-transporting methylmalonyl-CoA/oxaloacetate decarboxylase gamma subunit
LGDYERALEIAGTGIGVVFLALATLTLVTMVLTRWFKEAGPSDILPEIKPVVSEPVEAQQENDPAVVAAMIAAIQVVRGGITRVAMRPLPSTTEPTGGAWRSQGRQALMGSQGVPTKPRSRWR